MTYPADDPDPVSDYLDTGALRLLGCLALVFALAGLLVLTVLAHRAERQMREEERAPVEVVP